MVDRTTERKREKGIVMLKLMAVAGTAMSLLLASPASASSSTSSRNISLQVRTVNGTGCPAGTTAVAAAEDGEAFTVTYSGFKVNGGDYKNCQLAVKVRVPAGLTYAVYSVDNRGYALLSPGSAGRIQMTSYFTGSAWTLGTNQVLRGPFDDYWQTSNVAGNLHWAPCNKDRFLNINNTIRVNGRSTDSMMMSSTDASVSTVFHLKWRSC